MIPDLKPDRSIRQVCRASDDRHEYDERQQLVFGTREERVIRYAEEFDVMLTGFDKRQFTPEFTWLGWVN